MPTQGRRRTFRGVRNRDGVVLAAATAVLLFAGELTNPVLRTVLETYVGGQQDLAVKVGALVLVFLAYTSAFGSLLASVAAYLFARNKLSRGRFFLGLGVGLSLIGLSSKISAGVLGGDWSFLVFLATTFTGVGVLSGIAAQITMSARAMALKKRWKRLRKLRAKHERAAASQRKAESKEDSWPLLPDH